jgi:hypothetical protein
MFYHRTGQLKPFYAGCKPAPFMKSASAYYLILLYAVAVCKPFLPLVNDWLAHSFWNSAHLEMAHHTHGSDHVHYELKEAAKQEGKETTGSAISEPVAVHTVVQNSYNFSRDASAVDKIFNHLWPVSHIFLETHTPPPKA